MLFIALSTEMQISGLLSFIHNVITIFLSILVLSKAIKTKKRMLYVFSLFLLLSAAGYYQIGLNYIYWVFTTNIFPYQAKVLIGTLGIGIATVSWLYIYFNLLENKYKNYFIIGYSVFTIFFYGYLIFFLFLAPGAPIVELIGTDIFPYEVNYTAFILIAFFVSLIITTITTYHLAIHIMRKKETNELVWKGRFLALGMTLITISAMVDIQVADIIPVIITIRIIGIFAIFFMYLGFVLPNWIRKLFKLELK
jgi:hypothetical protein